MTSLSPCNFTKESWNIHSSLKLQAKAIFISIFFVTLKKHIS